MRRINLHLLTKFERSRHFLSFFFVSDGGGETILSIAQFSSTFGARIFSMDEIPPLSVVLQTQYRREMHLRPQINTSPFHNGPIVLTRRGCAKKGELICCSTKVKSAASAAAAAKTASL